MAKGDLKSSTAIYMKGGLFLALGVASAAMLLADRFRFRDFFLLCVTIWAFCRAYYFAFYVIQHYVDPSFRFAGLVDFVRYLIGRPRR